MVIAFLMWKHHWHYREALEHCKRKHRDTDPNKSFVVQLRQYERELVAHRQFPEDAGKWRVCGKCGEVLFCAEEIAHGNTPQCPDYYLRSWDWGDWQSLDEGEISCFHCQEVVGSFSWNNMHCECGCPLLQNVRIRREK